jgi:hypothetical protein
MEQDKIKEAFQKAKQDIFDIREDLNFLAQDIQEIKRTLKALVEYESHKQSLQKTQENQQSSQQTNQQTQVPTNQHINTAQNISNSSQEVIPTQEHAHYALKQRFMNISTGNDGVPTNQPTNQQTNQHPLISYGNSLKNASKLHITNEENLEKIQKNQDFDKISHLEQVSEVLSSLDNIKKELRTKFKHLTSQEVAVFSAIYQLEEQGFIVDYSLLSQKLAISEISIRDYTRKLLEKGIPIIKTKENNKKIHLSIASDLKKIASLSTILALREL